MRTFLAVSLALLTVSACAQSEMGPSRPEIRRQNIQSIPQNTDLQVDFITDNTLPKEALEQFLHAAQDYSDLVSRRRKLDFFKIHPKTAGLSLQWGQHKAHILSLFGTALTRNDLNVELRILQGTQQNLNLNYSGPITRNLEKSSPPEAQPGSPTTTGINFELMMGLPGEGVTQAYAHYLEELARYLPYRYQARAFEFDDGPLVYAVTADTELLGFVFCNQRNYLTLGEQKYADIQNLVFIAPNHQILGAYTMIAFNPKTEGSETPPELKFSEHPELGHMIELGEY